MKKFMACVVAGTFMAGAGLVANASAQEGAAPAQQAVTQGQVAQMLVKQLGLWKQLPANPTDFQCIEILTQNGIFPSPTLTPTEANPAPGWDLSGDAAVTADQLAVLLVRALGLADKVEGDVADIANWVNVLKGVNVPAEKGSIDLVKPIDQVLVGHPIFQVTPDPLTKRFVPEPLISQIINLILAEPRVKPQPLPPPSEEGKKPKPVTPNFPFFQET